MAPGGSELVAVVVDTDDEGALPPSPPAEQPVNAHPLTTIATVVFHSTDHRSGRRRHRRTVSIYAKLPPVMARFGFCECCRP